MDIQRIYEASYSRRGFFTNLEKEGYTLVRKNRGITGVSKDGESQTFKELGLTQEDFEQLDIIQEHVQKKVHQRLNIIEKELGIPKQQRYEPKIDEACKPEEESAPKKKAPKTPKR